MFYKAYNSAMKNILSALITITLVSIVNFSAVAQFDYDSLVSRVQEEILPSNIGDTTKFNTWIAEQNADGSWSEFPYGSVIPRGTNSHLKRLLDLAKYATLQGHPKYGDSTYLNAIKYGLHYWEGSNTTSDNWWEHRLNWPQRMGMILILMREFPDYLNQGTLAISEADVIGAFQPTAINEMSNSGFGANMMDIALHYVYRGILTEDSTLLVQTRNYCEDNMLTNIKADGSFHEHSAQMHVASYATVFASVTITLSYYLAGTPAKFDVNSGNYSTFLSMFKNYILPGLRGGHWDFSGLGRGITRANGIRSWMSIPQKKLIDGIDTASADLYQASIDRTTGAQSPSYAVEPNNTHFWESDYSRHIRPEFYFSMRGFSTRTVQTESGINQENLKGHYLSHGATCIMVEGDEYLNIMPVWD